MCTVIGILFVFIVICILPMVVWKKRPDCLKSTRLNKYYCYYYYYYYYFNLILKNCQVPMAHLLSKNQLS